MAILYVHDGRTGDEGEREGNKIETEDYFFDIGLHDRLLLLSLFFFLLSSNLFVVIVAKKVRIRNFCCCWVVCLWMIDTLHPSPQKIITMQDAATLGPITVLDVSFLSLQN